jgi:hypothetical protein
MCVHVCEAGENPLSKAGRARGRILQNPGLIGAVSCSSGTAVMGNMKKSHAAHFHFRKMTSGDGGGGR